MIRSLLLAPLLLLQQAPPPAAPAPPPEAAVVAAVARAARENAALPAGKRLRGDDLADRYVRIAAGAAAGDPRDFLGGLAVAVDVPGAVGLVEGSRPLETDGERAARRRDLGDPTFRGRRDLLLHFLLSAVIAAELGPDIAEAAGMGKEVRDADPGGSGFSFADLLADLAGIRFASWLAGKDGKARMDRVAKGFRGVDFLPDSAGQPEGLSARDFAKGWGSLADDRFREKVEALRKHVAGLAPYRAAESPIPK